MSKCDYCFEWEYFEGYGASCFCTHRTKKLPENEDCEFYADAREGGVDMMENAESVKDTPQDT